MSSHTTQTQPVVSWWALDYLFWPTQPYLSTIQISFQLTQSTLHLKSLEETLPMIALIALFSFCLNCSQKTPLGLHEVAKDMPREDFPECAEF